MTSNAKIAPRMLTIFFFFNDTATTEIYTLSLHDALPICRAVRALARAAAGTAAQGWTWRKPPARQRSARTADRKSTRLNSSHLVISYAVFCLKKKTKTIRYLILGCRP